MKEGFTRSLVADRIVGATERNGRLAYLIKWKDTNDVDLVFATDANIACPQVVIEFFEKHIVFHK
jgi:Chromo shadow domain